MINIIKTAIITILISFASGLMLDYYKNLAPRILCNIRNCIPTEINGKKVYAYIITVNNASNKTIHDLTLNIQSSQTNLNSTDATITRGLKFNSSIKDNILDVYIPFLSKGDGFSAKVYVENQYTVNNRPVIVIRSPENFKEIDSIKQNEKKDSKTIVTNTKDHFSTNMNKAGAHQTINRVNREILHGDKKPSNNKKIIMIIVAILLVMISGVFGESYIKAISTYSRTPIIKNIVPKRSTNQSTPTLKSIAPKKSTDVTGSAIGN